MSAWVKKIDTACLKIFQVSADKGMGKWRKLVEFSTKKLFQICACVDVHAKSKTSWRLNHVYILTCKHTSGANQSVCTILVIL